MNDTPAHARIYLVSPQQADPQAFAGALARVLDTLADIAPPACLRIDLGEAPEDDWRRMFDAVISHCHTHDVALLVRDHYRLVAPHGLDGVHLAKGAAPLREVRDVLGSDRIVGAHAGASRHRGLVLGEAGADYVAFGPVGEIGALGTEERAEDELFAWWAEMIEIPCVVDGGVGPAEAARLAHIADFIVPDRLTWDADDPAVTFSAFATAISRKS